MNKNKLSGNVLAGDTGKRKRVANDYYATPPSATKQFLNAFEADVGKLGSSILEPACGGGHISNVLKDFGYSVTSTDLVDRGYKHMHSVKNFLEDDFRQYDTTITNPPFRYAQEFIEKALTISKKYVIMFAKIQLLEGKRRYQLFKQNAPNFIYVHSSRVNPYRNGSPVDENGKKWNSTMCFAWYVWEKGNNNEPIVRWLE